MSFKPWSAVNNSYHWWVTLLIYCTLKESWIALLKWTRHKMLTSKYSTLCFRSSKKGKGCLEPTYGTYNSCFYFYRAPALIQSLLRQTPTEFNRTKILPRVMTAQVWRAQCKWIKQKCALLYCIVCMCVREHAEERTSALRSTDEKQYKSYVLFLSVSVYVFSVECKNLIWCP